MIKPPPENRATQVTDANGREYGGGTKGGLSRDNLSHRPIQASARAAGSLPRLDPRCGRWPALLVERDEDLAVGAALLDVRQRLEGLVERERLVDDGAEVAGVVEGGQLAQLPPVGLHE